MFSDRRDSMTNPDATRMLLVAIAVVTPFAGDVIEAHQLGVVGLCFSRAFGVIQFRGHGSCLVWRRNDRLEAYPTVKFL